MRIALAQINVTVGDLPGNAARIVAAAREALAQGAVLLVTPELSLCGYPPEDLLLRPAFIAGLSAARLAAGCARANWPRCSRACTWWWGMPHQFGAARRHR
jgi:NAD+ synthase (glutamine-hydrolysing)